MDILVSATSAMCKQSPYIQIVVGASGGFVVGFTLLKIFKIVAFTTGTTIIVVELALQSNIVTIPWDSIFKSFSTDEERESRSPDRGRLRERQASPEQRYADPLESIKKTVLNSARLCFSFLGGVLIGMGVS
ncbi:hypothetical protein KR093_006324 [Drosophila rubida]|uniref:FUN14 domain-containing protein 1 n=1 Tax=Drosophila rubida TaxID=30044 RepID=A0AAD4PMG1_9MUSC|nr:hypothetical protein KR093_006324 [Drosophila rubida]